MFVLGLLVGASIMFFGMLAGWALAKTDVH